MHKFSLKTLFITILFLLIPIVLLFQINKKPSSVLADWFNDAWSYRQAINISSHTVGETSVYIITSVNIGTTTKAQADDGDFRFTTASGQLLDYYIASDAGSTAPTFHILIDSFPAGAQTIYAYYGNSTAANGFLTTDFATLASNYSIGSLSTEEIGGGPVAHWKFDEGLGTTAYDSTQNGNTGVFGSGTSAPTWTDESQCISGKCLRFDGNDFISLGTSIPTIQSVTFWIKSSTTAPAIIDFNGTQTITVSNNIVSANNFSSPLIYINGQIGTTISANSWNYITVTTTSGFASTTFRIGKVSSAFTTGYLDDIKIYPYARSATQIKQDYNLGTTNLGGQQNNKSSSDGLVAYYKFDEGVGTTSADSSGNSNTATFATGDSAPSWGSGKYGVGASFDGVNDYMTVNSNLANFKSKMTTTAWVKIASIDSTESRIIWSKRNDSFSIYNNGSSTFVRFQIFGGGSLIGTTPLSLNTWYFVAVTYDDTSDRTPIAYINGVRDPTTATAGVGSTQDDAPYPLKISGTTSTNSFNGLLDEIRIYNRVLSPTDIKNLYNYSPGPLLYFPMDEKNGTTVNDKSGNNITATFNAGTSAPSWSTGKYGSGLNFNSTNNSSADFSLSSIYTKFKDQMTISTWYKNISPGGYIYASSGGNFTLLPATNNVTSQVNSTTGRNSCTSTGNELADKNWHYLTSIYNGTNITLYIDGIQKCVGGTSPGDLSGLNVSWRLGGRASLNSTDGFLDEFKIYNYARTQEQILQDMSGGSASGGGGKLGGPILYYKLDEGHGTTAYNSGIGSTALKGTLSNTSWTQGKINKGLNFNGTTSYISVGSTITNTQSLSFWVNPSGITNNNFLSLSSTVAVGATGNTLFATGFTSPTIYINGVGTSLLTTNIWQHVVITTGTTITSNAINIGKNSTNFFTGFLDEIKIYNYPITKDEVKTDYNAGASVVFGNSNQTIGATTTSLDYCLPGDTSPCSPPVAEWKFDEGTGTTAFDTGSGIKPLALDSGTSSPQWQPGKFGKSLYFDGTDDVGVNDSTIANILGPITVNAWIKTNSALKGGIVSRYNNHGTFTYNIHMNNGGTVTFNRNSDGVFSTDITSTISVNDNQWHLITGYYDGTQMKIFIDGKENNSVNENRNAGSGLYSFCIGNEHYYCNGTAYNGHFTGFIDQVTIYNYARTPAQIAYDYNKGAPIGWWKLDECQGSVANDSSGVGNSGAISIGASGTQNSLGTCQVGTSAAWTTGSSGKINSSLNFDGTDDVISIGGTRAINTVSFWTKPTSSTTNLLQLNSSTNITASSGNLSATGFTTPTYYVNGVGTSAISANIWQLVTISTGSTINANLVKIGQVGSNYYSGQIDDVRLYNYSLTSTQIKNIYNGGAVNFR